MIRFDEKSLINSLTSLSQLHRAAAAAAATQRLLAADLEHDEVSTKVRSKLNDILNTLWTELISARNTSPLEITVLEQQAYKLIPSEGEAHWSPFLEDAAAALTYTLRCWHSGEPSEAVWALRRVYDALDYYVINIGNLRIEGLGNKDTERKIVAHPAIQLELQRQQRDLDELLFKKITISKLKERAQSEATSFVG